MKFSFVLPASSHISYRRSDHGVVRDPEPRLLNIFYFVKTVSLDQVLLNRPSHCQLTFPMITFQSSSQCFWPNAHWILPCEEKKDPAEEIKRSCSLPTHQHSQAFFSPNFRDALSKLTHAEAVRNDTSPPTAQVNTTISELLSKGENEGWMLLHKPVSD